ncbi:MAG: PorP/SprF family type IX secretion system membrane protein [Draconibacterium sp.]
MLRVKFIIVLCVFVISVFPLVAQDVSFSQFYANPVYLNPAFAGTMGVPKIALQYRDQWQGFDNAFTTYSASFDAPVPKLRGGLGFYFMNDVQAGGAMNAYQINGAYSVSVRLNKDFMMNLGIQAGFNQNSLRVGELVFADNVDIVSGNHGVSGELAYLTDPNYTYWDFGTGALVFSERYFAGISVSHLSEPYQSYSSGELSGSKLPRKFTAHFGARLPVYLHGHLRKKFDISPQVIVQSQGKFQQFNYGLFAAKRGIALGTWFRQNFGLRYDAVIFLVGFVRSQWQFTYSYDFTVSGLAGNTGGTSEVSMVFLLHKNKGKTRLPFYEQYFDEFGED